jgi:hypothetical protein
LAIITALATVYNKSLELLRKYLKASSTAVLLGHLQGVSGVEWLHPVYTLRIALEGVDDMKGWGGGGGYRGGLVSSPVSSEAALAGVIGHRTEGERGDWGGSVVFVANSHIEGDSYHIQGGSAHRCDP